MSNWWKSLLDKLDKLSNGFCSTSISCRRDLQIIKTWCRCFCKKLSRNPLNVLSLGHFLKSSSCPAAYPSLRKAAVARMHFPLPRILKACRASYSFFFLKFMRVNHLWNLNFYVASFKSSTKLSAVLSSWEVDEFGKKIRAFFAHLQRFHRHVLTSTGRNSVWHCLFRITTAPQHQPRWTKLELTWTPHGWACCHVHHHWFTVSSRLQLSSSVRTGQSE